MIFVKDGSKLSDPKTKSIKCNISKFIQKYMIEPPKFIAKLPEEYVRSQMTFFERAYMEILEHCMDQLIPKRTEDDLEEPPEFKQMFTTDGQILETIMDI